MRGRFGGEGRGVGRHPLHSTVRYSRRGSPRPPNQEGKKSKVELLGNVRLFSTCNKRELARIASLVDEVNAPKGKMIVRQGDPGREGSVIADGKAKATIRGKSSALLGRGSCFGEMSLLDQGPRSATVTAETALHLLVLGHGSSVARPPGPYSRGPDDARPRRAAAQRRAASGSALVSVTRRLRLI